MNKFTLALASATALALSAGAVYAQATPAGAERPERGADMTRAEAQQRAATMFARRDANNDGVLNAADREALQAQRTEKRAERQGARFEQLDADNNGMLSRAEFDAGRDQARERLADRREDGKRGKRGKRGPGMAKLDGDSTMTQAQFTTAAIERFDRADANRDGTLTSAERKAQRAERRAARTEAKS